MVLLNQTRTELELPNLLGATEIFISFGVVQTINNSTH